MDGKEVAGAAGVGDAGGGEHGVGWWCDWWRGGDCGDIGREGVVGY